MPWEDSAGPDSPDPTVLRTTRALLVLIGFSLLRCLSFAFNNLVLESTVGTKSAWLPFCAVLIGCFFILLIQFRIVAPKPVELGIITTLLAVNHAQVADAAVYGLDPLFTLSVTSTLLTPTILFYVAGDFWSYVGVGDCLFLWFRAAEQSSLAPRAIIDLFTFHVFILICPLVLMKEFRFTEAKGWDVLQGTIQVERKTREAVHDWVIKLNHELRTPLGGLFGYLDSFPTKPSEQQEALDLIHFSAYSLKCLIDCLLEPLHPAQPARQLDQNFSPKVLLRLLVGVLAKNARIKGVKLVESLDCSESDEVAGNPSKLTQILWNLGNQVIDASPDDSPIVFSGALRSKTRLSLRVTTNCLFTDEQLTAIMKIGTERDLSETPKLNGLERIGGSLAVETTDNATTIQLEFTFKPAEAGLDRADAEAEDPFSDLQGPKLFLQPALVNPAQAHTAFLEAVNDLADKWAAWYPDAAPVIKSVSQNISQLPALPPATAPEAAEPPSVEPTPPLPSPPVPSPPPSASPAVTLASTPAVVEGPPEILVVDDNLVNTKILCKNLEQGGYAFRCARNGREAIEQYLLKAPTVILMDVNMPEVNGYEATQAIRQSGQPSALTIPIIALTATTHPRDLQRCIEAGMNATITKPARKFEIYKVLAFFGAKAPNMP